MHFNSVTPTLDNAVCFQHGKMLGYHSLRQAKTTPYISDASWFANQSGNNFQTQWMTKYF
jgi:hypothetical protein